MVEMMGVEPMSKRFSILISPSAVYFIYSLKF
nr:MAG TPA: hypothetical protein [Caudoviricetes sp.]